MKKFSLILAMVLLLGLLAGCTKEPAPSEPLNEPTTPPTSTQQNAETAKPTPSKAAQVAYEQFLNGKASAVKKNGSALHIQDLLRGSFNKYALYDMNGDAIPELLLQTGEGLTILWMQEGQLSVWYSGTVYCKPLNNGAVLYERVGGAPPNTICQYYVLNYHGDEQFTITFQEYELGDNNPAKKYLINGEEATEDLYTALTTPLLDIRDDHIIWKDITENTSGTFSSPEDAYAQKLQDIKKSTSAETLSNYFRYFYLDIDGNSIQELCITQDTQLTVYTFLDNQLYEVGSHDFSSGTLRLADSQKTEYPGIFYFLTTGGREIYGYLSVRDNTLSLERLWDNNFGFELDESGNLVEIGRPGKATEYTDDKAIIAESKALYENNAKIAVLPFDSI